MKKQMSPEAKEVLDRLAGRPPEPTLEETLGKLEKLAAPVATQVVEGVIGKNLATPVIGQVLALLCIDYLRWRVLKL